MLPNPAGLYSFSTLHQVFVCYSHKDERWKDLLLPHLQTLANQERIEIWDDRRIDGGAEWYPEIIEAIDASTIAVCLISPDFLSSNFILKEEIPRFLERRLERRDRNPLLLLPVLIRPCLWKAVRWLRGIQMMPRDGRPLLNDPIDLGFLEVAQRLFDYINPSADVAHKQAQQGELSAEAIDTSRMPQTSSFAFGRSKELSLLDQALASGEVRIVSFAGYGGTGKSALVNQWIKDLEKDGYRGLKRVFAWSFYSQGTGERVTSAEQFVSEALEWFGASQIVESRRSAWDRGYALAELVSAHNALLILDGLEPLQSGSEGERGKVQDPAIAALLTRLSRSTKGLCVITTRVRIPELECETARQVEIPNLPGLDPEQCVPVNCRRVHQPDIEQISDEAGVSLLRDVGVRGTDRELKLITRLFKNHALAVNLVAPVLRDSLEDRLAVAEDLLASGLEQREPFEHPMHLVMDALAKRFGTGPEVELLHLIGLFDRPATHEEVEYLRSRPALPMLTKWIHIDKTSRKRKHFDDTRLESTVARLRDANLLARKSKHRPDELDTHPAVRDHFGRELVSTQHQSWVSAHEHLARFHLIAWIKRLYESEEGSEFLRGSGKIAFEFLHVANDKDIREIQKALDHLSQDFIIPALLDDPPFQQRIDTQKRLYLCVVHACAAGRHQEALDKIYWPLIHRRNIGYSHRELGLHGEELAILANMFESRWKTPLKKLHPLWRAFLPGLAGARLRSLGKPREAIAPLEASLNAHQEIADALHHGKRLPLSTAFGLPKAEREAEFAALRARHLAESHLVLGELRDAERFAEQSVRIADKNFVYCKRLVKTSSGRQRDQNQEALGNSVYERYVERSVHATILHHLGKLSDARSKFEEAERILHSHPNAKTVGRPKMVLYSLWGFRFCDCLIDSCKGRSEREYEEIKERCEQMTLLRTSKMGARNESFVDADPEAGLGLVGPALENLARVRIDIRVAELQMRLRGDITDHERIDANVDQAVNDLRVAARQDFVPLGLLSRARWKSLIRRDKDALNDIHEVVSFAARTAMELYQIDALIELARRHVRNGEFAHARIVIDQVLGMTRRMGYGRGQMEVDTLLLSLPPELADSKSDTRK